MLEIKPLHIIKRGALTEEQIETLNSAHPNLEIVSEDQYEARVDRANRDAFAPYLKELKKLSFSQKLDWYSKRNGQEVVYLGNNPYFQRYWKWRVVMPIKFKRFFYRVKNGEIFKHYQHITEMKKKVKPHSI